jgi:hypothetical protein
MKTNNMVDLVQEFPSLEPLKCNRWLIRFEGLDIEPYLFRKYKMYNEGDEIIFLTEYFETVQNTYNPKDLLNIVGVTIEYLDPTGAAVQKLKFDVKGLNFEIKQSYGKDKFQITKLRFVVKTDTLHLEYQEKK